jgi:glutathione S-transferase
VGVGFGALETMLARSRATGRFCHGDEAGLADVFLVPQVFNANRYGVGLATFPTIRRINDECLKLAPFQSARPENQPGFA